MISHSQQPIHSNSGQTRYLFTLIEQIENANIISLQSKFKDCRIQHHPHQKTFGDSTNGGCRCENCFGNESSHTWSLQDATAIELIEYVPKQLTYANYHIGLDYNLIIMNPNELSYREKLTNYAINDCIAMQGILIKMKQNNSSFNFKRNNLFDMLDLIPISNNSDNDLFNTQSNPSRLSNKITFKITSNAPFIEVPQNNYTLI
ncbi:unnamed protein product [Adineta steineri]|uniref:Uncharacterized protein n=2 Tax=Adineta steineri TaxID=433720 RepID=A0A815KHI7_9BILA|nr:unnamed protein product [Adineta steineri]